MFQSVGVNINKDLKNVLRAKKVPFRKSFMERPHLELEYFKGRNKNASENTMDHLYDMMKSKKDNMMNSMKKMYDKNFSKQEEPMKEIPKLFTKKTMPPYLHWELLHLLWWFHHLFLNHIVINIDLDFKI